MPERLRLLDVCLLLEISPATARRWIKAGKLPRPTAHSYHFKTFSREAILPYLSASKYER